MLCLTLILLVLQDHVGAGVLLTKRDTFLTRAEYGQLVWIGCGPHTSDEEIAFNEDVEVPVPAVLRPSQLFTGKQVDNASNSALQAF